MDREPTVGYVGSLNGMSLTVIMKARGVNSDLTPGGDQQYWQDPCYKYGLTAVILAPQLRKFLHRLVNHSYIHILWAAS